MGADASFGMHVCFRAHPGRGAELVAVLLDAAVSLGDVDTCQLYVVSCSPDDEDLIWVTEAWVDRDAHTASLDTEDTKMVIKRAIPLMAGPPEATALRPMGGKGLALTGRS